MSFKNRYLHSTSSFMISFVVVSSTHFATQQNISMYISTCWNNVPVSDKTSRNPVESFTCHVILQGGLQSAEQLNGPTKSPLLTLIRSYLFNEGCGVMFNFSGPSTKLQNIRTLHLQLIAKDKEPEDVNSYLNILQYGWL